MGIWPPYPGESLAVSFARSYTPLPHHTERRGRTRELAPVLSSAWRPSWVLCSWGEALCSVMLNQE